MSLAISTSVFAGALQNVQYSMNTLSATIFENSFELLLLPYLRQADKLTYILSIVFAFRWKTRKNENFSSFRSSWSEQKQPSLRTVFLRKVVLKICSKFTGEHSCRIVISVKLLCNFIETTLRHWCSPVNLLHIFRTPFSKNTSGGLRLSEAFGGLSETFMKFFENLQRPMALLKHGSHTLSNSRSPLEFKEV